MRYERFKNLSDRLPAEPMAVFHDALTDIFLEAAPDKVFGWQDAARNDSLPEMAAYVERNLVLLREEEVDPAQNGDFATVKYYAPSEEFNILSIYASAPYYFIVIKDKDGTPTSLSVKSNRAENDTAAEVAKEVYPMLTFTGNGSVGMSLNFKHELVKINTPPVIIPPPGNKNKGPAPDNN